MVRCEPGLTWRSDWRNSSSANNNKHRRWGGVNSAAVSYRLINAGQIRHICDYFQQRGILAFWLDKPTLEDGVEQVGANEEQTFGFNRGFFV